MLFTFTKGIVQDIDDPAKAGRILCSMTELEGDTYPEWIHPIFPFMCAFMPYVNDTVMLLVPEDEDDMTEFPEEVYYFGVPRTQEDTLADVFLGSYGQQRGIYCNNGHYLLLDESKDAPVVELVNQSTLKIRLDSTGIKLGSDSANEPFVLGNQLKAYLTQLNLALTATAGVIPDPTLASNVVALKSTLDSGNMFSNFIFGQKVKP